MADKIYINSRFCYREDTFDNWQNANPVLLKGELSFVRDGADGNFVKIGDGVTPWNALPFAPLPKGENGENGMDYVLTPEDIELIASLAKPTTDQTYSPTSENAQSGKAVAEAIKEEWVQIADLTLEEESVVYIDTDVNGNSFNLKKFTMVAFIAVKDGDSYSSGIRIFSYAKNSTKSYYLMDTPSYAKNVTSTHRIEGTLDHSWTCKGFAGSGHNTYSVFPNVNSGRTMPLGNYDGISEPITSLRLQHGDYGITKGSRIVIWGVNA